MFLNAQMPNFEVGSGDETVQGKNLLRSCAIWQSFKCAHTPFVRLTPETNERGVPDDFTDEEERNAAHPFRCGAQLWCCS